MNKNVWKSKGHFQNIKVELPFLELEILRCFESLDWGLGITLFKLGPFWNIEKILKNISQNKDLHLKGHELSNCKIDS
jgi:hypothetical protein